MKRAYQRDDDFLRDVADRRAESRLNLWWLGQSGFLLQYGNAHLLFDPYLSDSLTAKYAASAKPHDRITERVIAPEHLDFIDVVTSSHNHTDHLDGETLIPLLKQNQALHVVVPRANVAFAAERLHVATERLTALGVGERIEVVAFALQALPAAHEELEQDEAGNHHFLGYLVEVAGVTIYHSGDTVLYEGIEEFLAQPIDIAILPINGRDPARGVAGNLTAAEAVGLARQIGAGLLIPCHFDMFEFNTVDPAEFVELANAAGQPYALLRNGEGVTPYG